MHAQQVMPCTPALAATLPPSHLHKENVQGQHRVVDAGRRGNEGVGRCI